MIIKLLLPFSVSLLFTLVFIPVLYNLSPRLKLVAQPRSDRWHDKPTPKIGGIVMFFGYALSIGLSLLIIPPEKVQWGLLVGSLIVFLLGLIDDLKQISPTVKIIGQIFAASLVVFFGRSIGFFPWESVNIVLTFIWLVGISNAVNLLDNMDGLAGGIAFIAAGLLSYLFFQIEQQELLIFSLAIAGSLLGFLFYNFPPAKVFMGDSGSLFLGFTLAALSIARVARASNVLAVLGVPIMLFLLPILDTSLVTITRILRGQSPVQGGRDHTSHRLIAFGLSEKQTVLVLYGVALVSGILGTVLESLDYSTSLVLLPLLILIFTLFAAYLGRIKMVNSSTPSSNGVMTKLMLQLSARARLFEIALDFFIISITYYLAVWTQSGFSLSQITLDFFTRTLPLTLASAYLSFVLFGIYKNVWEYIGVQDYFRFALAAIGTIFINKGLLFIFGYSYQHITIIHVFFAIYLFIALTASRSSFKIFDQFYLSQSTKNRASQNVLIYQADDAGEFILRWLRNNPEYGFKPKGIIDDDPFKVGRQIHGVHVIGSSKNIENIITSEHINGIIIANENTISPTISRICKEHDVWLKHLNISFEPIDPIAEAHS